MFGFDDQLSTLFPLHVYVSIKTIETTSRANKIIFIFSPHAPIFIYAPLSLINSRVRDSEPPSFPPLLTYLHMHAGTQSSGPRSYPDQDRKKVSHVLEDFIISLA